MNFFRALNTGVLAASGAAFDAGDDRFYGPLYGGAFTHSASGMRVTPETAKMLPVLFACASRRSTAVAMLPFKMYSDGKYGRQLERRHPLADVLYVKPNPVQTAFEFKQMMQQHVDLRGNAYAEIIDGPRGAVDELWPMHPDRVIPEQLMGSGKMRYRYADPLTGTTRVLMQEEVFHLRWLPEVTGVGQSRIAAGAEMLGLGLAQQDYRARFMANDASPGPIILGANFKKTEDEDAFIESLQKARTKSNRGRPYMLPPGLDIKTLSVTPVDAQLLESAKATDAQICALFDILPHVIGIDAGKAATFASTEQFNLMHVQQCVLPMVIMWEQAISRCLITSDRFYAKASLASLMRGDAATRGKFYQTLISCGMMCPDEGRELEDMNPIEDGSGKKFWRPMNWSPLDQTTATALPAGALIGEETDVEDEDADPETSGSDGEDDDEESDDTEQAAVRDVNLAIVQHGRQRPERGAAA